MQLDEKTRAEAVLGMEAAFRDALKTSCSIVTQDSEEQHQIASSVLALMLKKMYQDNGREWLERVITMVLTDAPNSNHGPSPGT